MMNTLRQYIFSIIVVSVIVAILNKIPFATPMKRLIKMISGVVLTIVLISPLNGFQVNSILTYFDAINWETQDVVSYGEDFYVKNLSAIISEKCESYILDKAEQLGVTIAVSVACDSSENPTPNSVQISGNISPYAQNMLKRVIANDIGIPEENQLWR